MRRTTVTTLVANRQNPRMCSKFKCHSHIINNTKIEWHPQCLSHRSHSLVSHIAMRFESIKNGTCRMQPAFIYRLFFGMWYATSRSWSLRGTLESNSSVISQERYLWNQDTCWDQGYGYPRAIAHFLLNVGTPRIGVTAIEKKSPINIVWPLTQLEQFARSKVIHARQAQIRSHCSSTDTETVFSVAINIVRM